MSPSINEFTIDKSYVGPGDLINVTMSSNNKYCGHKIESFKFKLFRKI
jgi:hypothetical protein